MQGEYKCSNEYFGDPAPGMSKSCFCKEQMMDTKDDSKREGKDGEGSDTDDDEEPYDQAVEMDTPVGEMSVEWDDGYYEGAVYMDDEEYAYNFRRSNAVKLGASTIAVLSAAFMA